MKREKYKRIQIALWESKNHKGKKKEWLKVQFLGKKERNPRKKAQVIYHKTALWMFFVTEDIYIDIYILVDKGSLFVTNNNRELLSNESHLNHLYAQSAH